MSSSESKADDNAEFAELESAIEKVFAAAEKALEQARSASNRSAVSAVSSQLAGYRRGQPLRMLTPQEPRAH